MSWTNSVYNGNADPTDIIIEAFTTLPEHYTNAKVKYWLKATLDDYVILYPDEATIWVEFDVNIQNCQVNGYSTPDPSSSYRWDSGNNQI